jgi:membrane-bound lytic murein transglycosylase A
MKKIHRLSLLLIAALLGACSTLAPSPVAPLGCPVCEACRKCPEAVLPPLTPPVVPAAQQAPLQAAAFADLPAWAEDDLAQAWPGFLRSCSALRSRPQWGHWRSVCEAAETMPAPDGPTARQFFEARLTPWALTQPDGSREGLITGYYEPILKGSRTRSDKSRHPVLGVPDDLLNLDFGELYPDLRALRLRGRVEGRKVLPYYSRAEIRKREADALAGKTLAWVDDPVELFFLHIQGSGRIALAEGGQLRVGYADQNGHPYLSIGRVLIERGDLKPEQASMQGIQAWVRANPGRLDELLNANPSYVFFRELPGGDEGPPGALGVSLIAERAVAIDPRSTPLGAPVFLATTQPNSSQMFNRLMLAQDTGGAIKGVVRADLYFGTGHEAGQKAGRMKQKGRMWVLLPPGYPIPEGAK